MYTYVNIVWYLHLPKLSLSTYFIVHSKGLQWFSKIQFGYSTLNQSLYFCTLYFYLYLSLNKCLYFYILYITILIFLTYVFLFYLTSLFIETISIFSSLLGPIANFVCLCFWGIFSLCNFAWAKTHCVDKAGLKLVETFLPLTPECWDQRRL